MTKAEVLTLINERLAEKALNAPNAEMRASAQMEKEQVSEVVETFFDVIKDAMEQGNNIYMRGFGSFVNKKRARKTARNIKADTTIIVEAHYVPSFKPSKVFTQKVKTSAVLKKILKDEAKS